MVLDNALARTQKLLSGTTPVSKALTERLSYGWGNESWSAKPLLLEFMLNRFRTFSGVALECGSGLSTVLLTLIAANTRARIMSLEHNSEWLDFITARLHPFGPNRAKVLHAPLKSYGEYDWYSDDQVASQGQGYDLVLCDGPPSSTRGGRYGLVPRMLAQLAPGATIIVDDSQRADETQMIGRWMSEYPGRLKVEETYPTFTILRVAS